MRYSVEEIKQYAAEEDVKFIRMAFCDVEGHQKNIAIMPSELDRAFRYGVAIDGSAIPGFGGEIHSDLLLHPDPGTLSVLPWRPEHGRVVRMFCSVTRPGGQVIEADTRSLLKKAVEDAQAAGLTFTFGTEMEFYLFRRDEDGQPTRIPYDDAGYMDIAPADKGENVRREVCLTLERMGIRPESSHHEEGPGQNEIDFRYADPLTAADNALTFRTVVDTAAARNGLYADFGPKPLENQPGNGLHINFSVTSQDQKDVMPQAIAGVLAHSGEMTAFLNPTDASYSRFGSYKAPRYISWSAENRSQLIRVPAAEGEYRRAELRSPDPLCNPYLAFTLLLQAGLEGLRNGSVPPVPTDIDLQSAPAGTLAGLERLPDSLGAAIEKAQDSIFVRQSLPAPVIGKILEVKRNEWERYNRAEDKNEFEHACYFERV